MWHTYGMIRYDMIRYDLMRYDSIWYDIVLISYGSDMILYCYHMIWYDLLRYDMYWYDIVSISYWSDLILYCFDVMWYDVIWHILVRYDMIRFDLILFWYNFDLIWYCVDFIGYDVIRCDMIWYERTLSILYRSESMLHCFDMIWWDMMWHDYNMIWYDLICHLLIFWRFQIMSDHCLPEPGNRSETWKAVVRDCFGYNWLPRPWMYWHIEQSFASRHAYPHNSEPNQGMGFFAFQSWPLSLTLPFSKSARGQMWSASWIYWNLSCLMSCNLWCLESLPHPSPVAISVALL